MIENPINFHDLYSRYAGDVYCFSFWLTGNTEDAQEAGAVAFGQVWQLAPRFLFDILG